MDRRDLIGLCCFGGFAAIVVPWALQSRNDGSPLSTSASPDPNVPSYAVDLATPPKNLAVTALSDTELATRGITRKSLGTVAFASGAIVAADPVVQPERLPFARTVEPGRYEIELYLAQGRNALLALRFAPSAPSRWQLAVIPGQDVRTLKNDETFGYPVDAGLGTLMDATARDALLRRDRQEQASKGSRYSDLYDDVVAAPLDAAGGTVVLLKPLADDPAIVPIVQSGWGDGFYASYWGLGPQGEAVLLVTDFGVLESGDGRDPGKH